MIGKVFLTGKTFGETCEYLCQEQSRAKVLAVEGVRGHDHRLMAEDFEWQHRLMPGKEKPVFHGLLSFPHGERLDDARLVEIAKEFLKRIEVVNTQYAFVKHLDKEHLHVHILANRVNNDGDPTAKGLVIERSIKAAKELTQEYGLRQEDGKNLGRMHLDALHEPDVKRYRIYSAIQESLPRCRSLDDLSKALEREGITMRYRRDAVTEQVQGISFRLENRSFKGSRVDTEFSLKGLERTLALQQKEEVQRQQALQQRQAQEFQQRPAQEPQRPRTREQVLRDQLSASLEKLMKGRPAVWDEKQSVERRRDLKDRLEKAEQERHRPALDEQLRLQQEQEQTQEIHQVQRRGLRH